ncbi:MFS transporter [Vibrio sp. JPW-9-11-11]|uniref:MFS transporter n=1 Tax=Vibrio sp. JPW-9-11-11 TaxID=1416532 RepID=UPI001594CF2A|nr:MFS transporter [Vibrio sp. JPW-9-11-11]NVD07702.1 MFS transporter [Vibrio sp. JPW-9-11-11]
MFNLSRHKTASYLSGRFFDGLSSGLFMMALPWIMLQSPNMGSFVALVALTCTLTSFILTPFFATLIDRHSRKQLLILVQVVQAATALCVLLSATLNMLSPWILAGAQLVFWVSSNLAWATNNAFTQENYQRHEYAAISGKQEIVMQVTTLGAGALGVVLLQKWGIVQFALFAALASTLSGLSYAVTYYHRQLTSHTSEPFFAQLKQSRDIFSAQPRFFAFLLLSCLCYPVLTFLLKLVPIWFAETGISGEWFAGYSMAFGLGSLFSGALVIKLLAAHPHPTTMLYSMLAVALSLVGMSQAVHPSHLLMFTLVFGFFNALNRIARTNWMHNSIDIGQRGRVDGGLALFSTSMQSISYVLIALLSKWGLTQYGFILAAMSIFGAVCLMWLISRSPTLSPQWQNE